MRPKMTTRSLKKNIKRQKTTTNRCKNSKIKREKPANQPQRHAKQLPRGEKRLPTDTKKEIQNGYIALKLPQRDLKPLLGDSRQTQNKDMSNGYKTSTKKKYKMTSQSL